MCFVMFVFLFLEHADNRYEDPLGDGHGEQKKVKWERNGEAVVELPQEAHHRRRQRQAVHDIGREVNVAVRLKVRRQARREHLPAAHSRVEGGDDALEEPRDGHAEGLEDVVDDGGGPLLELLGEGVLDGLRDRGAGLLLERLADGGAERHGLGEVHTERRNDGEEASPEPRQCLGDLLGLDGLEDDHAFASEQLGVGDLEDVGDTVVVGVDLVILARGLEGRLGVHVENVRGLLDAAVAREAEGLEGGDEHQVGAAEEAHDETDDHGDPLLGVVRLKLLVDVAADVVRLVDVGRGLVGEIHGRDDVRRGHLDDVADGGGHALDGLFARGLDGATRGGGVRGGGSSSLRGHGVLMLVLRETIVSIKYRNC
eukprot:PhM_4_TR7747/c0_g1_i1/m.49917